MRKTSTKPQGATSYKETAFGIIPRSKLLKLEIEGVKKGLEYLIDIITTKDEVDVTTEFICRVHAISFGWIFPIWGGKFRTIQVTYSGKEASPCYKVPERNRES